MHFQTLIIYLLISLFIISTELTYLSLLLELDTVFKYLYNLKELIIYRNTFSSLDMNECTNPPIEMYFRLEPTEYRSIETEDVIASQRVSPVFLIFLDQVWQRMSYLLC